MASFLPLSFASVAEADLDFKAMQEQPEQEEALLDETVQQEWISYPEAERYSGLSHTTLWRYVNTGQLKAARVGRSVRIHLPSLKQFMEAKATLNDQR